MPHAPLVNLKPQLITRDFNSEARLFMPDSETDSDMGPAPTNGRVFFVKHFTFVFLTTLQIGKSLRLTIVFLNNPSRDCL